MHVAMHNIIRRSISRTVRAFINSLTAGWIDCMLVRIDVQVVIIVVLMSISTERDRPHRDVIVLDDDDDDDVEIIPPPSKAPARNLRGSARTQQTSTVSSVSAPVMTVTSSVPPSMAQVNSQRMVLTIPSSSGVSQQLFLPPGYATQMPVQFYGPGSNLTSPVCLCLMSCTQNLNWQEAQLMHGTPEHHKILVLCRYESFTELTKSVLLI